MDSSSTMSEQQESTKKKTFKIKFQVILVFYRTNSSFHEFNSNIYGQATKILSFYFCKCKNYSVLVVYCYNFYHADFDRELID